MTTAFGKPGNGAAADVGGLWKIERQDGVRNIYHLMMGTGLQQHALDGADNIIF